MPYSNSNSSNLPDYVKKLSSHKRKIWVAAFNNAYASFDPKKHDAENAEAYAFAVANAAVKSKRQKESMTLDNIRITAPLDEIEFLEGENGSKRAQFTVIRQGWSLNKRYYSGKNLQEISDLINQSGGTMMFFDHRGDRTNRSMKDWAATLKNSTLGEGLVKGAVDFTENGAWLWEEVKKHPHLVQISINAKGKVRPGIAEGQEGDIVDSVNIMESVDFVTKAAAGGGGERILAGFAPTKEEDDEEEYSVKGIFDKIGKQNSLYNLTLAFLRACAAACAEDDMSAEEKKEAVKKHIDDFRTMVDGVDFDLAVPMYASAIETEKEQTVSEGDQPMDVKELKTPDELKANNEGVYTAVVTLAKVGMVEAATLEASNKEIESLKAQVEALNKEKKELAEKNAEHEKRLHEAAIDALLAPLSIKDKAPLREQLIAVQYEAAKKIVEAMQSHIDGSLPAKKSDNGNVVEGKGKAPANTGELFARMSN